MLKLFYSFLFFMICINVNAQDIEVIYNEDFIYAVPGTEIIFDMKIVNISAQEQTVFLVRTRNELPPGLDWSSSLCFGENCYAPSVDSVTTNGIFPFPPPLQPQDTIDASVHVFTQNNVGTAYVQVQIGALSNPDVRDTLNFIATTDPTMDVNEESYLSSFYLAQNYPNPFNPATRISYKIGEPGLVQMKVYNVLGVEVARLINEYKNSGEYSIDFDASSLSSGVYFYTLSVNNFTQTRKMILEK